MGSYMRGFLPLSALSLSLSLSRERVNSSLGQLFSQHVPSRRPSVFCPFSESLCRRCNLRSVRPRSSSSVPCWVCGRLQHRSLSSVGVPSIRGRRRACRTLRGPARKRRAVLNAVLCGPAQPCRSPHHSLRHCGLLCSTILSLSVPSSLCSSAQAAARTASMAQAGACAAQRALQPCVLRLRLVALAVFVLAAPRSLALAERVLFAGGRFDTAGVATENVAEWNGTRWADLAHGANGIVVGCGVAGAVTPAAQRFLAAGCFHGAGGEIADGVAQWDGATWSPLGDGIGRETKSNCAYAVAAVPASSAGGDDVETIVLGGQFTMKKVNGATNVAAWRGGAWSAMGMGLHGESGVRALAVYEGATIAAGGFTTAGASPGPALNYIARWDGVAWGPLGLGMNGTVFTLLVADDGLLAGGSFTSAGGVAARGLARWDGTAWSAFGGASSPSTKPSSVRVLAVYNGDLIAAGNFFEVGDAVAANNIAAWNGTMWRRLDAGTDGPVYALAEMNGDLYVGGSFFRAGGIAARSIARWDGAAWSALSEPLQSQYTVIIIFCLVTMDSRPIPTPAPTVSPSGTSRRSRSTWSNREAIRNRKVIDWSLTGTLTFAPPPSFFFIRGDTEECPEDQFGPLCESCEVCAYHGTCTPGRRGKCTCDAGWSGSLCLDCIDGDCGASAAREVYIGGSFTTIDGRALASIALWNGTGVIPLDVGILGSFPHVNAIVGDAYGTVYVGGQFSFDLPSTGATVRNIARWNGRAWSTLGNGVNGQLYAAVLYRGNLVVGGAFTSADDVTSVSNIAMWATGVDERLGWLPLATTTTARTNPGPGVDGSVYALAAVIIRRDCSLYVGGVFTSVLGNSAEGSGSIVVQNVAKYDGEHWSSLGTGLSRPVYALVAYDGALIAGGAYGDAERSQVARWDGAVWSALPGLVRESPVRSLVVFRGALYAAATTLGVRKWYRGAWKAADGTPAAALSLAVDTQGLYVLGPFTLNSSSLSADGVVLWNGTTSKTVVTRVDVSTLAVIYVRPTSPFGLVAWVGGTGGVGLLNRLSMVSGLTIIPAPLLVPLTYARLSWGGWIVQTVLVNRARASRCPRTPLSPSAWGRWQAFCSCLARPSSLHRSKSAPQRGR